MSNKPIMNDRNGIETKIYLNAIVDDLYYYNSRCKFYTSCEIKSRAMVIEY